MELKALGLLMISLVAGGALTLIFLREEIAPSRSAGEVMTIS